MGNHGKRIKMTNKLEDKLFKVSVDTINEFFEENKEEMINDEYAFANYMRRVFKEKGVSQQEIFLYADIPERYGYKLISQEKHTRQRDIILRICYSAGLTIEETQKALRLYGMAELYVEYPRDALLMVIFKDRPGDIIEVNLILRRNGMDELKSSGIKD
ncbi:MAG: hypothetical protein IKS56_03310 [Lachnospiraceae bacterium]|nr:hypothetical protein [Lachnospiraceae bacterium]